MKYCYRLNKGLLNFDQVKKETLIKYKIHYNPKKDLYYSSLDPEYKEKIFIIYQLYINKIVYLLHQHTTQTIINKLPMNY